MLKVLNKSEDAPFVRDSYFDMVQSKCDAGAYKVFTVEDARRLFNGRDVYLWGAGQKGRGFLLAMRRNGFEVKGMLDMSPALIGTEFMGAEVYHPESVLKGDDAPSRIFVLTATVDIKNKEIFKSLTEDYGFERGKSFDSIQALSPFYPTVEVAGLCNLRCSSCPRSDQSMFEPGKFMSFEDYEKVVNKLVREIPFLYLVDLYIFGEPMLNPDIAKMIRLNNTLGLATGLSTNLNNIKNLEAALDAFPAQLRVSLSGVSKETYEATHTGGSWERVSANMKRLSELNEKYGNRTIVELYFHIYKHNIHEMQDVIEMCEAYKFRFHPSLAVLFPDYVLKYLQTGVLPQTAEAADSRMLKPLKTLIDDCISQADKNCTLTRIVPVVNWDLSVMACCNYSYTGIASNYLEVELSELIERRTYSSTCATCQKHALHRWNNQGSYSSYISDVVNSSTGKPAE